MPHVLLTIICTDTQKVHTAGSCLSDGGRVVHLSLKSDGKACVTFHARPPYLALFGYVLSPYTYSGLEAHPEKATGRF